MRRVRRVLLTGVLLAGMSSLVACVAPFPDPPAEVGTDFPGEGVPVDVAWPSDWLEGFVGESEAVGGSIVGLRLEYVDERWVWRVRSIDPGKDVLDERITDPARGRESLVDAATLALLQQRQVTLSAAELAEAAVSASAAAQLSGESYPSPRLIELERRMEAGHPVWQVTTYDTDTGLQSTVSLDATAQSNE